MTVPACYRVGLVISRVGMNDAQVVVVRHRLFALLDFLRPEESIAVSVPVVRHAGPKGREETSALLPRWLREKQEHEAYERVSTELLDIESPSDVFCHFNRVPFDEVWCLPTNRQSAMTYGPWALHAMAQREPIEVARRFKLIGPWVEVPPEMRPTMDVGRPKKPALKGY